VVKWPFIICLKISSCVLKYRHRGVRRWALPACFWASSTHFLPLTPYKFNAQFHSLLVARNSIQHNPPHFIPPPCWTPPLALPPPLRAPPRAEPTAAALGLECTWLSAACYTATPAGAPSQWHSWWSGGCSCHCPHPSCL